MKHTEFLYLPAGKSAKKSGKKYSLAKSFIVTLPSGKSSEKTKEATLHTPTGYIVLSACRGGYKLVVPLGWEWDGPSGPTLDTPNNLLPSLVHDALYALMRASLLDLSTRSWADRVFYQLLRQEGVGWFRANYYWLGVSLGAEWAARPSTTPSLDVSSPDEA